MEVHHHPIVEKKSFKEYVLEGLMIFLAVTMGFFAEGFREHLGDRKKEKEFIISCKEDLLSDTMELHYVIPANQEQFDKLDSLYILLDLVAKGNQVSMNRLYYLNFRYATGLVEFNSNRRTIAQIISTGAFAVIKNKAFRDSITEYDNFNENIIKGNETGLLDRTKALDDLGNKVFDFQHVKTFWFQGGTDIFLKDSLLLNLNTDTQLLLEYRNRVRSLMMMVNILKETEKHQAIKSKNIINLINKEYHLENN